MHILDVILYIIAVVCFAVGVIETLRAKTFFVIGGMLWLFGGLLAWVLVPALSTWGVH